MSSIAAMQSPTLVPLLVLSAFFSNEVSAGEQKITCTFETFHQRDSLLRQKAFNFSLGFGWDEDEGSAYVLGNQGRNEVEVVRSPVGITFLEILATGVVQSTTVAPSGDAVHSRHTIIGNDLVPSQYYGKCGRL